MDEKIRLGISSCLLGQRVRHDGQHKLDRFLVDTLGRYVEYVPVCPEVESGFPVPREAMRLVGDSERPRLVTVHTNHDVTDIMVSWASERLEALEREDLCGFIFKSRSPSSGMERVKVYNIKGMAERKGVGIFARAFMERFPLLPVEEEGRLNDPRLRENFIERIFVMRRWRELMGGPPEAGRLVEFHTRHKLLILSHSLKHYRDMGRMVAALREEPFERVLEDYQRRLMEGLRVLASARKHVNVMHHIMGFFKKDLSADEKAELVEIIEAYRQGHVPLIVPITLLNHYVRKYQQPYLAAQHYLRPHPLELQLRNHV